MPNAPSSVTNSNSAGAFKAHSANENDTATYTPATKRPRGAENYSDEVVILEPDYTNPGTSHPTGEDDEGDELCHRARWQASEQLSAFLGTLHKPLSAFERKANTRKYSRPDVDCVYTPTLDNYLPSLLPGVNSVDKDNKFLQDLVLDSMGLRAMLFEHIYGFLAKAKPGENVILNYERMKDLGAITSNAISLLGNASALLSKERRKAVLKKNQFQRNVIMSCLRRVSAIWQKFVWEGIRSKDHDQIRDSKDLTFNCSIFSRPHHPLQKTREPLGWCQSKVSKCQQLQPVSGFIQRPGQSYQGSPANPSSHPVERPSHLPPGTMLHLNLLAINHLPLARRLKHCISNWEIISKDPWVLETVQGFRLDLISTPN